MVRDRRKTTPMHSDTPESDGGRIAVRSLGPGDIPRVMELEGLCFAYHWTEEQFRLGLERGAFRILGVGGRCSLLGYMAYSVIEDEMEVLNLAVHPDCRRRGLGRRLMEACLDDCRRSGVRVCFLDVKVSNHPAIDLYVQFGFKKIGIRKKYYPDTKEDALLYRKDMDEDGAGTQHED